MSATYAKAGAGRHRGPASSLVLPKPPNDEEKYLYIHRNLFFLATTMVIGASTVIISQVDFETHNPLPWPFVVFTVTFFAYQVISLPVNFTGSGFDQAAHHLVDGAVDEVGRIIDHRRLQALRQLGFDIR